MKLVVGLGNPGKKYEKTRHNVGFILLDEYVEENDLNWKFERKFNAEIAKDGDLTLAKPQTFMNKSGQSVAKLVEYFEIDLDDLVVVHDDVDLDFGVVKKQKGRGDAGHKGVKNIVKVLGSNEFWRQRVGVGRSENADMDTDDWVLMNFNSAEYVQIVDLTNLMDNL